jgi:hypothetical protein
MGENKYGEKSRMRAREKYDKILIVGLKCLKQKIEWKINQQKCYTLYSMHFL